MWFWWFMLICNLWLPVIMIVAGRMMWKHCPKDINGIYGYRTKRSRMNQDTWKFAHEYCGRLWWKIGIIMFVSTILIFEPFIHSSDGTIGMIGLIPCIVQCFFMIVSIAFTELALKRIFTDEGKENSCNTWTKS